MYIVSVSDPPTIHQETGDEETLPSIAPESLDRLSSFLLVFGAIMLFLSGYLITVQLMERNLQFHFNEVVADAIRIEANRRPPGETIRRNLIERVDHSDLVQFWGVRVHVSVLARDDETWLYVNGRATSRHHGGRDGAAIAEVHAGLLPATARVEVSIGHNTMLSNSILSVAAALLFAGLFLFNRHVAGLQDRALDQARETRDLAAREAQRIEREIERVREQLRDVEPANQEQREETGRLQSEQREFQSKLDAVAARESALRSQAERARTLEDEALALDELLDETTRDLDTKNQKIRELENTLKRESRGAGAAGGKSKHTEVLAKRLRLLYPNVEVESRAIEQLIGLRDESAVLRAEECIKRLNDDADNAPVRRKVHGLPSHLSIYEMGFAGKRRLYISRQENGRFRVLVIGAKNSQQTDLDFLARIPVPRRKS